LILSTDGETKKTYMRERERLRKERQRGEWRVRKSKRGRDE
jgi:hypothetical protein